MPYKFLLCPTSVRHHLSDPHCSYYMLVINQSEALCDKGIFYFHRSLSGFTDCNLSLQHIPSSSRFPLIVSGYSYFIQQFLILAVSVYSACSEDAHTTGSRNTDRSETRFEIQTVYKLNEYGLR